MLGHVEDALTERHASEERLRSFAADASHELRTPVATIRGSRGTGARGTRARCRRRSSARWTASSRGRPDGRAWSTTCCCSPASTRAGPRHRPGRPDPAGRRRGQRRPRRRVQDHHWRLELPSGTRGGERRRAPTAPGRGQPARRTPAPTPRPAPPSQRGSKPPRTALCSPCSTTGPACPSRCRPRCSSGSVEETPAGHGKLRQHRSRPGHRVRGRACARRTRPGSTADRGPPPSTSRFRSERSRSLDKLAAVHQPTGNGRCARTYATASSHVGERPARTLLDGFLGLMASETFDAQAEGDVLRDAVRRLLRP